MEYFGRDELACKHCGEYKFDKDLLIILNLIREDYGRPIIIYSGYRCPNHPESIKSPTSSHVNGTAADILCPDADAMWVIDELARKYGIRRIGTNKNVLHIDYDQNKQQRKRWGY